MPHEKTTSARCDRVGNAATTATSSYGWEVEAACDAFVRGPGSGLTFDRLGLSVGLSGEALRLMLDTDDRHQLGASRLPRLLRALGTPEPFNAVMRLDGHQIGGLVHQLLPVPTRGSSGDVLADTAAGARELTTILETLVGLMDGGIDAVEAAIVLRLFRPHLERLHGVIGQLEAIARRGAP